MPRASMRGWHPLSLVGICIVGLMLTPLTSWGDLILRADHSDTPGYDIVVIDQEFSVQSSMRGSARGASAFGTASLMSAIVPSSGVEANVADLYSHEGLVGFSGAVGDYQMTVTTGMSAPLLGDTGRMDLFNVSFSGGSGTLTIELWDTGFDSEDLPTRFHTLLGGTTDGLVEIATYADGDSDAFGTDYSLYSGTFDGSSTLDGIAFSADHSADLSAEQLTGEFAMGIRATITHTAGNVTSFDIDFQSGAAVPEPATAVMALLLLLVSGLCRSPRRRCR